MKGSILEFPQGTNRKAVPQAQRAAKELAEWLKGSSADTPPVFPILVVPGWWVENRGERPVIDVFSGRNLAIAFEKFQKPLLSDEKLADFADRIESHCRDIDLSDFPSDTESR